MVAFIGTELGIEFAELLDRRLGALLRRSFMGGDIVHVNPCSRQNRVACTNRRERVESHAGAIQCIKFTVFDFRNTAEALLHHRHVRFHNRFTKAAELLLVLPAYAFLVLLILNTVILQKSGHPEECPKKGIALHPQLQVRPLSRRPGDLKTGQNEDPDIVFLNKFAVMGGDAFPGGLRRIGGFPDKASATIDPGEGVGVGKGLRIATEHHVDMVELAVYTDAFGGNGKIVVCGRTFFLRPVFGVGHDEELFHQPTLLIIIGIGLGDVVAE